MSADGPLVGPFHFGAGHGVGTGLGGERPEDDLAVERGGRGGGFGFAWSRRLSVLRPATCKSQHGSESDNEEHKDDRKRSPASHDPSLISFR